VSEDNPLCFILLNQICLCCGLNVYSCMWFCPVPLISSEGLSWICIATSWSWSFLRSQTWTCSFSTEAAGGVRRLVRALHNICPTVLSLKSSFLKVESIAVAYPSLSLLTSLSGSISLSAHGVGEINTERTVMKQCTC